MVMARGSIAPPIGRASLSASWPGSGQAVPIAWHWSCAEIHSFPPTVVCDPILLLKPVPAPNEDSVCTKILLPSWHLFVSEMKLGVLHNAKSWKGKHVLGDLEDYLCDIFCILGWKLRSLQWIWCLLTFLSQWRRKEKLLNDSEIPGMKQSFK